MLAPADHEQLDCITITPEMIEAGVDALAGWENEMESNSEAVTRIFLAMMDVLVRNS